MCGIAGIIHRDRDNPVRETLLLEMRDLLAHRGPDDSGAYVKGHVGMGHRRLSIIDLASGHQPIANEDCTVWIVFNGEIYNYLELRQYLASRGHIFKTNSDTEVILHLYEEKGDKCASYLNGIFAFSIWDENDSSLFLARDHLGIKPLYYSFTGKALLFSSEIKAILKTGYVGPECRSECIPEYFTFRHISGENTLFRAVKSLPPASTLLFKNDTIKISRYWSPYPSGNGKPATCGQAMEELSYLMRDSVKRQMISDVPLGTFCSGGLDSSLVTALAAESAGANLNTFSIGFNEEIYDETAYARLVSGRYGTIHRELKLDNGEFSDLLPKLVWHNDEPLNFANSVHIYALSRLAKEHVTVVLTGEGSDELFAGYPRYLIPGLCNYYNLIPARLRNMVVRSRIFTDHRIEKLHKYSCQSMEDRVLHNSAFLDNDYLSGLLSNCGGFKFENRHECIAISKNLGLDVITALSLLDEHNYLVSILNRQDKMSMAAGLESRVPFLDFRIVEFANKLPAKLKTKRLQTKYLLKRFADRYLPGEIIHRRKSGFGVPLAQWLLDPKGLGRYLEILERNIFLMNFLSKPGLSRIIREHKAGERDHSDFLWASINLAIWADIFKVN